MSSSKASGVLEIEGETVELKEGQAAFVPAGVDHRFVGYEKPQRARHLHQSQIAAG